MNFTGFCARLNVKFQLNFLMFIITNFPGHFTYIENIMKRGEMKHEMTLFQ